MSDFFEELLGSVDSLSEEQVHELLSRLEVKKSKFKKSEEIKVKDDTQLSTVCIHCGSENIRKHGFKSGRQRYYCKDCKKTFVLSTGTISNHSKLTPAQWKELLRGMVENLSLRKIAENTDLCIQTIWYNKQKVCSLLLELYKGQDNFVDIAECDEYYQTLSFKGKRDPAFFLNVLGRMPRHHRTYAEKVEYLKKSGLWEKLEPYPDRLQELLDSSDTYLRGISRDQTCILTCKDRSGDLFISPVCIGRLEIEDVKKHLKGRFAPDAIMVTDSHNSYPEFAKGEHLQLEQIETGKHAKGAYNLGRINALHSRIADHWSTQSKKAPATKYLDLGLIFFWWLEKNSSLTTTEKVDKLYNLIMTSKIETSYKELTSRPLTLNTKGLIPTKV